MPTDAEIGAALRRRRTAEAAFQHSKKRLEERSYNLSRLSDALKPEWIDAGQKPNLLILPDGDGVLAVVQGYTDAKQELDAAKAAWKTISAAA